MNIKKPIGLCDKNGTEIQTGDVVEFYFDENLGYSMEPDKKYTRMRDVVTEYENKFYFSCHYGSAFAWRHNKYCQIIGTDLSLVNS